MNNIKYGNSVETLLLLYQQPVLVYNNFGLSTVKSTAVS